MARPKRNRRGFRSITVDGRRYSWRLNTRSGLIEVNLADAHTQRLEVSFGWYDRVLYLNDRVKPPSPELDVVTPCFVERVIRTGLELGWNPNAAAAPMRLLYRDRMFSIAG